jgi:uncharacterized membrane protein
MAERQPSSDVAGIRRLRDMGPVADTLIFDATLRPNPPMRPAVLKLVIAVIAVINLTFGAYFVIHGAWPITPFMGADVAFLGWAFHASAVAARRREELRVTRSVLCVDRYPPRGKSVRIEFNPYWVRVEFDENSRRLTLASHGRSEQIGSFLPPGERLTVAQALRVAVGEARSTRLAGNT